MSLAVRHLRLRLRCIHCALRARARRQADELARVSAPEVKPAYISTELVALRLAGLDHMAATGHAPGDRVATHADEEAEEETLRRRARDAGERLPLDRIAEEAELDGFDVEALLMCATVEIDPRYGTIIAFILDDGTRQRPTVGLLESLTAATLEERLSRREALGPNGRLRRCGLVRSIAPSAIAREEELGLTPRALRALLGAEEAPFHDPAEVPSDAAVLPDGIDATSVARLGEAMRAGVVDVAGVWGPLHAGHTQVVCVLARHQHRRLRRLPRIDARLALAEQERQLIEALESAHALDALLWIDVDAHDGAFLTGVLPEALMRSPVRICLSGVHPFRPSALLAARPYAELTLPAPTYAARQRAWSTVLPELPASQVGDLAARYRLDTDDLAAVARMARTSAALASNGHARPAVEFVEPACAQLVRKRSHQFARVITPRRGPDDLVLAPDLFRQVMDVGQAFRAWPRVSDLWGLGRAASGGLKALFTGEAGTGKTLAAEVIASQLGLPLVKIDLAQIVSKWVGETEKNLEAAFREAEDGNAVLFFDEAEALFGKRGEVRHGTTGMPTSRSAISCSASKSTRDS